MRDIAYHLFLINDTEHFKRLLDSIYVFSEEIVSGKTDLIKSDKKKHFHDITAQIKQQIIDYIIESKKP